MVEGRGEAREKSRRGETAKGGGRGGEGEGGGGLGRFVKTVECTTPSTSRPRDIYRIYVLPPFSDPLPSTLIPSSLK